MAYGTLLTDAVQSSTAGTPPQFNDGNGTQVGTLCRAWVTFDASSGSSCVVKASFNVSSVTYNGTTNYNVNFTTPFPDAYYAVQYLSSTNQTAYQYYASQAPTTSTVRITLSGSSNPNFNYVAISR